jgi:hypothetical protein
MPTGKEVACKKWSNEVILFDDGYYSAIWGNYENSPDKKLGVRWNGQGSELGFPSSHNKPVWFIEWEHLVRPILLELLFQTSKLKEPEVKDYVKNIQKAISEIDQNKIGGTK